MKRIIFTLTLLIALQANAQQWSPITSGNIWNLNSGNVGIGTTTPQAKLHVNSGANNSYASILATSSEGNNLVVSSYATQPVNIKVFSIVHEYLNANRANGAINFYRGNSQDDGFLTFDTSGEERLRINSSGNIGIGTTTPYYKLDVQGIVRAHEIRVNLNSGADFVFEPDYKLMPLNELAQFIATNKHLPEVAPAAVMEAEGIELSDMNAKLLQKVEELTLYLLELNKEIQALKADK